MKILKMLNIIIFNIIKKKYIYMNVIINQPLVDYAKYNVINHQAAENIKKCINKKYKIATKLK